ncbi:unnamed protein product [Moneuplotes crassus]|uniref:DUF4378 domain-containing protein n=1 Tax=Euplotes crassus TaxID=5936 RepID=A0AAD1XWZ4_EUPCR|nr:unnamed protein product [Moneuplotes crassus]
MNKKSISEPVVKILSPKQKKRKKQKKKNKEKENIENHLRLLQDAGQRAQKNGLLDEKNILDKIIAQKKADLESPNTHNPSDRDIMKMLTEEVSTGIRGLDDDIFNKRILRSESHKKRGANSSRKVPGSPEHNYYTSERMATKLKTIDIERCCEEIMQTIETETKHDTNLKTSNKSNKSYSRIKKISGQVFSPSRSTRLSLISTNDREPRASVKTIEKFNEKVRKANLKMSRRRKSKSSTRKEKVLAKLEKRIPKCGSQPHIRLIDYKDQDSKMKLKRDEEELIENKDESDKKTGIILFSASKTKTDLADTSQHEKINDFNKHQGADEFPNTLEFPDPKEERKSISPSNNERDTSLEKETLEPIYDTSQFKKSTKVLGNKLKKPKIKTKKSSRSKHHRNSVEERKGSRNSSNDSRKNFKSIIKRKKTSITRPLSGGIQKHGLNPKLTQPKHRPRTAKQLDKKLDPDVKSLSKKKLLSPSSSKRHSKKLKKKTVRIAKSGNKKTNSSSKNNRKTSLSPSTEIDDRNAPIRGKDTPWRSPSSQQALDPEIQIHRLNQEYLKEDKELKIIIIQKYMEGFKVFNHIKKVRKEAKLHTMKFSSCSSNTFERATSQADLIKMMKLEKSEEEAERLRQQEREEAKIPKKIPKRSLNKDCSSPKRKPYASINSLLNKSFEDSKNNEIRKSNKKSFSLSLKKRPNTANIKKGKNIKAPAKLPKTPKKLKERVEKTVLIKPEKPNPRKIATKPPTGKKELPIRENTPISKSSLSELLTHNSPMNDIEGFEKYQTLIKKKIKEDCKSDLAEIQQKADKKKRNYDERYKLNKINDLHYTEKMKKIQEWQEKATKKVHTKKKYYLHICGYFKELMRIKDGKVPSQVINFPNADSDSIANSSILEGHVRGGSQHLPSTGRNHIQKGYSLNSSGSRSINQHMSNNKTVSHISDPNGDSLTHRAKNIDIINPHDQSISSKGPIVPPSDMRTPLSIEDDTKIGRKSENLFNYKVKSIEYETALKAEEEKQLKENLEETKENIDKSRQPKEGKDELVGYPSQDEESYKKKIEDFDHFETESNQKEQNQDLQEGEKQVQEKMDFDGKSEDQKSAEIFPNISDKTPNVIDQNTVEIEKGSDEEEQIFQKAEDPKIDENSKKEDIKSSSSSSSQEKEVLITSSRSNIPISDQGEDTLSNNIDNQESPFGVEEKKQNKPEPEVDSDPDNIPQTTVSGGEDNPTTVLLPPRDEKKEEIEDNEKRDDKESKNESDIASTDTINIKDPEKSPSNPISIPNIACVDLTGGTVEPRAKGASRTTDNLIPGPKSNIEKSEMIAEQLLFYLKMELMSNVFPQRVNVSRCRERTEKEILEFEKKSQESAKSNMSEPPENEQKEGNEEDDFPQNKMAIKTDKTTIKSYVNILFEKMKGRELDLIGNLSSPLQRNPLEILMHLQNTFYELEEDEQLPFQQSVLPVDIYLDIERGRRKVEEEALETEKAKARAEHDAQKKLKNKDKEEKEIPKEKSPQEEIPEENKMEETKEKETPKSNEENSDNKDDDSESLSSFTKDEELDTKLFNLKCEWENIHNKAIFDAVNEALDGFRPYGLKGPPLPWSKQSRTLTYKNGDITEIPQITTKIEKKVLDWIGDQDADNPSPNSWEERLAVILANEIEETEPIWTDYEFEETHVKIDMAELILEDLFKEAAEIMTHRKVLPVDKDAIVSDEPTESPNEVTNNPTESPDNPSEV